MLALTSWVLKYCLWKPGNIQTLCRRRPAPVPAYANLTTTANSTVCRAVISINLSGQYILYRAWLLILANLLGRYACRDCWACFRTDILFDFDWHWLISVVTCDTAWQALRSWTRILACLPRISACSWDRSWHRALVWGSYCAFTEVLTISLALKTSVLKYCSNISNIVLVPSRRHHWCFNATDAASIIFSEKISNLCDVKKLAVSTGGTANRSAGANLGSVAATILNLGSVPVLPPWTLTVQNSNYQGISQAYGLDNTQAANGGVTGIASDNYNILWPESTNQITVGFVVLSAGNDLTPSAVSLSLSAYPILFNVYLVAALLLAWDLQQSLAASVNQKMSTTSNYPPRDFQRVSVAFKILEEHSGSSYL